MTALTCRAGATTVGLVSFPMCPTLDPRGEVQSSSLSFALITAPSIGASSLRGLVVLGLCGVSRRTDDGSCQAKVSASSRGRQSGVAQ